MQLNNIEVIEPLTRVYPIIFHRRTKYLPCDICGQTGKVKIKDQTFCCPKCCLMNTVDVEGYMYESEVACIWEHDIRHWVVDSASLNITHRKTNVESFIIDLRYCLYTRASDVSDPKSGYQPMGRNPSGQHVIQPHDDYSYCHGIIPNVSKLDIFLSAEAAQKECDILNRHD